MGQVVDTSVFVAVERGDLAGVEISARQGFMLTAMTVAELCAGIYLSTGKTSKAREFRLTQIVNTLPIVPFDAAACRMFGQLKAATRGRTVATADLIIAACAMAQGHGVLTRDGRSFPHIPGLVVEVI